MAQCFDDIFNPRQDTFYQHVDNTAVAEHTSFEQEDWWSRGDQQTIPGELRTQSGSWALGCLLWEASPSMCLTWSTALC